MKSVVISRNPDILTGMRLAGMEGILIKDRNDLMEILKLKLSDAGTGIIVLTHDAMTLAENEIMELKLITREKLIVEIPDFGGVMEDRMSKYIRDSIGIKID